MDRPWLAAVALLPLLAGCLQPAPTSPSGTDTATTGRTSGIPVTHEPAPASRGIVVNGTVVRAHGLFLANVTAHNTGSETYGWSQPYCLGTPWTAQMAGPSGAAVDYLGPRDHLGCASRSGTFPPGAWMNWTANPSCRVAAACDNWWDGRLWDGGSAHPAPAGTYTWTFTFPYTRTMPDAGGTGTSQQVPAREELVFRLTLP